jgi:hypothetical protein
MSCAEPIFEVLLVLSLFFLSFLNTYQSVILFFVGLLSSLLAFVFGLSLLNFCFSLSVLVFEALRSWVLKL